VRSPALRLQLDGIVIDGFAGGGGASTGIERAGVRVDVAINHDPEALAMHAANHPETRHLCGDIWDAAPKDIAGGRRVALAWLSPTCTHFSRAKGGPLKDAKIRSLAWVAIRWARDVRPSVICLENVSEFQTWGRLLADGTVDPRFVGHTFATWLGKLRALGYQVEMRELVAADYGAPTVRRRLFIIARCDGLPIVWPTPTHGRGLVPHRPAGDCIDWSIEAPSIFDRKKPLVDATHRRIAYGLKKFVLETSDPYVVHLADGRLVAPSLVQVSYGERPGQAPRALDIQKPLGTIVAGGIKHALVAAFFTKNFGGNGSPGAALQRPLSTITTRDNHSLVRVSLGTGATPERVRAFLVQFNGQSHARSLQLPLGTITTRDRFGLVRVAGEDYPIDDIGFRMLAPRELAIAQGFGPEYVLDPVVNGRRLPPSAQVRMIGNSVCPDVAEAIVRANLGAKQRVAA
jgi:DNA (cytosine-5)-methyltransferase 1